jgi:hypothetical protein
MATMATTAGTVVTTIQATMTWEAEELCKVRKTVTKAMLSEVKETTRREDLGTTTPKVSPMAMTSAKGPDSAQKRHSTTSKIRISKNLTCKTARRN